MDFTISPEQMQFADAIARWATKGYNSRTRRDIIASDRGVCDTAWAALVSLGATALPVPEKHGGFDGCGVDMFVTMQALGRALLVEPYFATVLGARFLALAGGQGALLEQVAQGSAKLACALGERGARHDLADIGTRLVARGDGFVVDGAKSVVLHGAQAGTLIVSARSAGRQRDTDGITLVLVPTNAAGVSLRDYRTMDGRRAAELTLDNVQVPAANVLGEVGGGWETLDAASDYGVALLCAEALGAIDALFDATLAYLKTRTQFGTPIGKFQALQHRMADMYIHLEQARSMAMLAAVRIDSTDPQQRRSAVSAAKFRVGQALRCVGQQAIQLHGGIGVTDELAVSHYFKRLSMIELTLGDSAHHLARFIAQPGFA